MRSVYGFARLRSAFLITFFITATGTAMLLLPSVELSTESISSSASQKAFAVQEVTGRGKPFFNFQDAQQMSVTFRGADSATQALQSGQAVARALAAGDLDGNGTPDVIAGYAYGGTGIVTIQRGNPDAFAPTDDSVFERLVRGFNPDSLLPDAQVYPLPVPADFLAVGNFSHLSGKDILFAAKGGGLYLMAGDGRGRFGEPEQITLPGSVTALAVGEFRAADGLTDVAVGVTGPDGESLLVFDGAEKFSTPLVQYRLAESAGAIEFGGLDSDPFLDVAVAAGSEIVAVHGWGRKESVAGAAHVERIKFGSRLRGLALGEFTWDRAGRSEMAVLTDDGIVQILQYEKLDTRPFTELEKAERTRGNVKVDPTNRAVDVESLTSWRPGRPQGWTKANRFNAGSVSSVSVKPLLRTNLSRREMDDLILIGEGESKLEILHPIGPNDSAPDEALSIARELVRATLDVASEPLAILPLPQKLNGVIDLVVLKAGIATPSIIPAAPGTTITVDRTDDPSGAILIAASACTGAANDCSLRGAFQFANNMANPGTIIMLPAGTYILSINGTSAGGCDGNNVGDLGANQSTTLTGAGAATTIIRQTGTGPANDGDRIMCMNEPFTVGLIYNFSGVSFVGGRDGTAAGTGTALGGGGIIGGELNNSLTMTNVVMANNQVTVLGSANGGGGGLQITGGNLIITNSTFGGTSAPGAYTDRSSTNTANLQGGSGGGVTFTPSSPQHMGGTGTLTITGSTFSRNTAAGIGGGGADLLIFAFASPGGIGSGSASIGTSTFSNNQALGTASGGGIIVESLATTVATTSFTNNSAANRGGGIFVAGASLLLNGTTPSITFTGNTATSGGSSVSTSAAVNVDGTNTTIGGDIEINTGGTWTNNTGSTLAPTNVVITGGTFNMNNSTMNVSGNLTVGPGPIVGSTFNGGTGTVNIQGNFVLNAGGAPATSLNAGTGTFNFNGTSAQSITNGTSITFFNLTDSNITNPLTANNSFAVGGTLNVNGTNAIFAPVAGAVISGAGTLTGAGTARVTRIAATADFSSQYSITNKTLTNLTVEYIGTAAQVLSPITFGPLKINNSSGVNITSGTSTVNGLLTLTTGALGVGNQTLVLNNGSTVGAGSITSNPAGTVNYNQSSNGQNVRAFNYGNLTFSNFNKVLEPTGTIGISGVFTPGTTTGHTITGSTVNFNGTGAQTVPAFNFNNLTISGTRGANNVTLVNGGTIGVVGIFNPTATFAGGNYVVTNNTVDFNGSGGQTIPAFNYFNLTSSSSGARTLASSGSIRVAGVFIPGTNSYIISGSTVEYNGAAAQTLPAGFTTYNNLTLNNTAGTSGFAGLIVQGLLRVQAGTFTSSSTYKDVQIDSGATLAATAGSTINVTGNWTNNGTFTPNDGAVNFNGSAAQTVSGSSTTTFNNLTINNASGVTLNADITINATLTLTAGALAIGSRTLTLNNALTITGGSFTSNANGTVNYNQSSNGQSVAPGNYGNLTFSNFTKTLPSSGTVKIAGTFTTGAGGGHTITGSSVEFNGAAAQTIPSGFTTYNNLTLNNAAGVTGFAGLTVQGLLRIQQGTFTSSSTYNSVQIDSGATLSATAGSTINIGGTWTNNGTFNANTGTVVFNGSAAQTINGTTTFNNLTINNSSGVSLGASTNVTVGGALTLTAGAFAVGTNTLTLNGAVTATGGSLTSGATGTVNYNQGSNGQAVLAANYGNLTFSNFQKILPGSGTVKIAGAFTTGAAGGHTITGSTVEYNGAAAQTMPAGFTIYNNLTINNSAGVSLGASSNVTVGAALTLTSGALAVGSNTLTLNGAVTATGGSLTSNANGTVNYNQSSNGQAVLATNYGNLTFSNFQKILPGSSTVRIAGTFATGAAGGHTVTGSTVEFNGTAAQTMPAGFNTYNNLTINNSSGVSLGASTNVTVGGALTLTSGAFAVGANTLTLNGAVTATGGSLTSGATGTVNYNQSSNGQAVLAANYGNLTFSNFTKTLPSSGTVKIAGTFTTGAGGGHTITGSSVEFNGAAAQTIPSGFTTYNNLTLNNAAGVTGFAGLTVQGLLRIQQGTFTSSSTYNSVQIDSGATLSATAGSTINIGGTWTNNGTFNANTGTVVFNGSSAQTISGTTTFNNLTINNAAGVNIGANISGTGILNLMNGNLDAGANTYELSASGSITRTSGYVLGNLKKSFSATGTFTYTVGTANGYSPVTANITAGTGDLTVKAVQGPQPSLNATKSLQRYWTLSGTGVTVDLSFSYLDPTDIMGNEAAYRVIRVNGADSAIFPDVPASTVDEATNTIIMQGVSSFSDWTAGEPTAPTAVEDVAVEATAYDGGTFIQWRTSSEVANLGFNLYRQEGGNRVLVNPQIVAGSALAAGLTTALGAGKSYGWWDNSIADCGSRIADCKSAQYWLEDIDLSGTSSWHGPVFVKPVGGVPPDQTQAALLSKVGNRQSGITAPAPITAQFNVVAAQRGPAAAQLAGQPAIKLAVRREGFYHVTAADLATAGLDPRTDAAKLQLFVDGRQVPIGVKADNRGALEALEFYGVGLDTQSTDARVYWLIAGQQAGLRFEQVGGQGRPSPGGSFLYTAERRDRTVYFSSLRNGERENFFGAVVAGEPVDQSIMLRHIDAAAQGQATVEVSLQGVSNLQHRVWAYLNGQFAGELSFSGQSSAVAKFGVANSLLREGENQIRLVAQGGPSDINLVDYVRVSYFHSFMADNDALRFTAAGGQSVTVGGFSNAAVRVFDITDADSVRELRTRIEPQTSSGYGVTVAPVGAGERMLLAIADGSVATPARVVANTPSSLRTTNHAADLVIITRRDFFSAFDALARHRASQGLKVELVDVEDIYDEFSFGHKSPQSIKEFLLFAKTSWKTAPRYVLFGADSSFDPKDYLGLGDWDIAPARLVDTGLMETASDDWFADFNGDGVGDLAVGRLPARTAAEASAVVAKIIGYEQGSVSEEMLLVADSNDTFSFEGANAQLRGLVPANLRVNEIGRGRMDIATARAQLIEAALRGQKIINYTGHGSVDQWRGGLLTNGDAAALGDSERASVFVMMTCLNSYGLDPAIDSLAEALLKTGRGGAVAVWASSGMTNPEGQAEMNRELYRLVFGAGASGLRLGDMTGRAKTAITDADVRVTWMLIGDPAMRVR